ncbi:dipeptide transporter substrate-binding periplasmic protein [Gluconacetobacter sacchari DSM 12717]|uniref:ABC transporter substrate-binding protein n=2 Tax=Gluconacetobacter sacchari TaxID=92759 RepID=A0A7W4IH54_9PROT|nr:ABC transporter substrate-binding protein [Gluconacetobacter sacchari]MBB2162602.1 ABC transporter substrate-binding protein [Gluconacetobacter sacchari]GBQ22738.1 dipeptide transporter substrate-binding periplasmic protein [Gluconacetobacter sacchari DSM 12717]
MPPQPHPIPHARPALWLGAAALLLAMTGCRRHESHAAAHTPTRGGTLVYATDREPICLDPHVQGDMPQVFLAQQYLDSLVAMDGAGHILPWLATDWTVSDDGRTYLFHLRHDVTFTDGTPFTAEAVRANLDHMVDPHTQSSTAGGYIRQYAGTDVIDAYTAAVHLKTPYAAFLEVLAQGFLGIESPRALARPRDENCQNPVGSGPFRIVRWDHQSQIVLERNPAYRWGPPTALHTGPARLDRIEWRIIPEPSVRFAALQAGEVDVIDSLPPEAETPARRNPDLWLLLADRPGNPTNGTLNTRRAPFDDIRVREAFLRSADIDGALASVFFHHYRRAGGPLSPTTPFYSPAFEHHADYDPDRARALLDQAGWTGRTAQGIRTRGGHPLVVHIPVKASLSAAERTLWEQVQATARATGFDVRLENGDDTTVQEREGQWDYDVRIGYWNTNTADVLRIIFSSAFLGAAGVAGHHQNEAGFSDPAFDRVVDDALLTTDPDRRRALYLQAQTIAARNFLQVTTYPQSTRLALSRAVHDVRLEPSLNVTSLYDSWVTR